MAAIRSGITGTFLLIHYGEWKCNGEIYNSNSKQYEMRAVDFRKITRNDVCRYGKCDYLVKNMLENVIFIGKKYPKM